MFGTAFVSGRNDIFIPKMITFTLVIFLIVFVDSKSDDQLYAQIQVCNIQLLAFY